MGKYRKKIEIEIEIIEKYKVQSVWVLDVSDVTCSKDISAKFCFYPADYWIA